MRTRSFSRIVVLLLLAGVVMACSIPLPFVRKAFPAIEVTPNLTMTALYAVEYATATPPVVPTAMPEQPTLTPSEMPTATVELATNTPTPATATLVPTVVPVFITPVTGGGQTRPGGYFVANYLSTPPVLDGNWDEWTTTQYPAGNVVYGNDNWTGENDLTAAFRIGWDYQYLYVAAKVKDDVYVQNASYHDIYKGDSLEILLDADLYGDWYNDVLSADDYQLGISPGRPDVNGVREAYLWYPYSIAGPRPEVKIAAIKEEGVYRVEAAIPWTVFGVSPAPGRHYGFAFSVSDNDNPSANVQQSMVSSVAGRRLTRPMTWGELVLGQ